jgi:hypothetical protein
MLRKHNVPAYVGQSLPVWERTFVLRTGLSRLFYTSVKVAHLASVSYDLTATQILKIIWKKVVGQDTMDFTLVSLYKHGHFLKFICLFFNSPSVAVLLCCTVI